jgi:hypothetical protein
MSEKSTAIAISNSTDEAVAMPTVNNQSFNDFVANASLEQIDELFEEDLSVMVAGMNVSIQYLQMEEKTPLRFTFMGIIEDYKTKQKDGTIKEMQAAVLGDADRNLYVYCASQLVGTLIERNFGVGSKIEICWIKTKVTRTGNNMRVHSVNLLRK